MFSLDKCVITYHLMINFGQQSYCIYFPMSQLINIHLFLQNFVLKLSTGIFYQCSPSLIEPYFYTWLWLFRQQREGRKKSLKKIGFVWLSVFSFSVPLAKYFLKSWNIYKPYFAISKVRALLCGKGNSRKSRQKQKIYKNVTFFLYELQAKICLFIKILNMNECQIKTKIWSMIYNINWQKTMQLHKFA